MHAHYGVASCRMLALLSSHVHPHAQDEQALYEERINKISVSSSSSLPSLLPSSIPEDISSSRRSELPIMSSLVDKAKELVAEKVASLPKPEASLTGVSVKRFSRDGVLFHSEVSVSNPYSHSLPICQISYTLKSADRVIASGTMPDPGSLAAKVVTKLEVPVKVPYDFLMSLARDIGRDWDIDYVLDVVLTVDLPVVGDLNIPVSTQGEIKLPTLADIF